MSIFRFKQFEVNQSGCAMKINTDGVLLAALLESDNPAMILDIGTGTGVIALMLAQRFSKAHVYAVEIDAPASAAAGKNFSNSVFSGRLFNQHTAIQDFETPLKFDVIVTNPPFFVNDFRAPEERKGMARHADEQFFKDLMAKVAAILTEDGCFWFVLPLKQAHFLIQEAKKYDFYVRKQINLHSDVSKPAFRVIVSLQRHIAEPQITHFYIYEAEKVYTTAYKELLKDFFIGY